MRLRHKDLLGLAHLTPEEIELILHTAGPLKKLFTRSIKKVPPLRGKTVALLFYEPSTRTRTSFELAATRLSADVLGLSVSSSSVQKGESLIDTALNLEAMKVDFIVVRHSVSGAPELLARGVKSHVVNAGDGNHEHPTQGLLDLFTIREKKKKIQGLNVAIIGDILHSRVARSNIWGLTKLGANVRLCGPATLVPQEMKTAFGSQVEVTYNMKEALEGADVAYVLRLQLERQQEHLFPSLREYNEFYGLDAKKLSWAKKDCIVMHPGPMNRGVEIASDVADGPQSVILDQVTNGIAVRMAVLYLLAGSDSQVPAAIEKIAEKEVLVKSTVSWARTQAPSPAGTREKPLLIRGGRVIDPRNKRDEVLDILIEGQHIEKVGKNLKPSRDTEVLDASGLVVTPGLIDIHVHLREPGQEEKETIATGTAAAAMGGFTAVACMPNTVPPLDNVSQIQYVMLKTQTEGHVRVYPIGAITKGQDGTELTEFGAMLRAGCVAVSDDGKPVGNAKLFRRALEYAKTFGLPVIDHCEDPDLVKGGVMNEGRLASKLGLKGIPRQAEYIMAARDIALCELTGGRLHLAHLSTKESIQLVRDAKKRGLPVTAETCPHYFTLTEEAVGHYDTHAKMNPPLRTEADRQAVIEGLADGTLDVIASDHAPHTAGQKAREFDIAPFGIIGLETTLGLVLTELVQKKAMSLMAAITALTDAPAQVLQLPGGHLSPGAPADLTIIDLKARYTVNEFASKSRNSPFIGRALQGRAWATIVGGDIVMKEGRLLKKPRVS